MPRVFRVMWLFVLAAPAAWAQGPTPNPAPAAPGPAPAVAPAAAPVPQPEPALKPTVTSGQMLSQGREYRGQIDGVRAQIQAQAQQAKNDKDVIRLNCVLDKLTQVNVNANMMDQALQALQDAVSRNDENVQSHEYTRITIINQKVQVLKTEADACVGAETNYVGPTKVVVEKPEGLDDDVDQPAAPMLPPFERPPPASRYQ